MSRRNVALRGQFGITPHHLFHLVGRSLHVSRTAMLGRPHRELQSAIAFVACGVEFPYFLHKFFAARQVQRLLSFVDAGFERGQQRVNFFDVGLRANGMQVIGYFFRYRPGAKAVDC